MYSISDTTDSVEPPVVNTSGKHKTVSRQNKSVKSPKSSNDLSVDIERTVRQLEKKLEEEDMTSYQTMSPRSNNIVPEVAEELGTG